MAAEPVPDAVLDASLQQSAILTILNLTYHMPSDARQSSASRWTELLERVECHLGTAMDLFNAEVHAPCLEHRIEVLMRARDILRRVQAVE